MLRRRQREGVVGMLIAIDKDRDTTNVLRPPKWNTDVLGVFFIDQVWNKLVFYNFIDNIYSFVKRVMEKYLFLNVKKVFLPFDFD